MLMKDLHWIDAPPRHALDQGLRDAVASLLRALGALLDTAAQRLTAQRSADTLWAHPMVEYHAEAGAPEGALYVNGRLVGRIEGVTRL
jgi:hypothetical protein